MPLPYTYLTYDEAQQSLLYCDSYSRLPTLLDIHYRLQEKDFLRLLGEEWTGFDNISNYMYELQETAFGYRWSEGAPMVEMMTPEELKLHQSLPDAVVVYRGCYKINKWGLSWSLSKSVAEMFPGYHRYHRSGDQPLLVTAIAEKKDIAAVKLDRDEVEVICRYPKHVSTRHIRLLEEKSGLCMPKDLIAA